MGSEAWRAGLFLRTWVKIFLIKKIFVLNRRPRMWRKARRAGHILRTWPFSKMDVLLKLGQLWPRWRPISNIIIVLWIYGELNNNRWSIFLGHRDFKSIKWIAEKGEGEQKRKKIEFCYIWWKCSPIHCSVLMFMDTYTAP